MAGKVHIGYGFHVNCYHSYRGDSNDELGFGGDIRIIRKIISILDEFNRRGVPAKATWDFENAYSLEDTLPRYAPDIIEDVRRRCVENGDENIIMGYNNGALSAMTPDEFEASIEWAVTNEKGSGLVDLFGSCERIVRPQEVMFTPSQVPLYNKCGVKAVCLYYSCVPFDAFRTVVPQLRDEYAFNPVTYTWQGESLVILPTYSNSDVIDAGSLRYLACDLHRKQLAGEIQNDVFIFINMDADAILWEPLELPFPLNRIVNTDGIRGLVQEVADLDFVVFDTPGGYLKEHGPLCEISFGHDTADGSFTGYSSWAEKPFNRQIWTRLERARAYARAAGRDGASPSFEDRVLLLSTTHFGLASPVLNVEREKKALELSARMVQKELDARPKRKMLTLAGTEHSNVVTAQLALDAGAVSDVSCLRVKAAGLSSFGIVPMARHADGSVESVFLVCRFARRAASHAVTIELGEKQPEKPAQLLLQTEKLCIRVCPHGEILSVRYGGRHLGGKDFLRQFVTYDGKHYAFTQKRVLPLESAGSAQGCRIAGEIHLPGELSPGAYELDLFTVDGLEGVLMQMHVQYPYTREENAISTQSSALGRKSDARWQEAAPLQLTPQLGEDLHVVKRNFMGSVTSYPVASFWESVPENRALASFNHQLTGGFTALSDGETGLLLAHARQVLGSMAHCPMRLRQVEGKPQVSMNPFGTYYGKQRVHPTRSNGAVGESFVMVAPQAKSLAPAYNGVSERFMLYLSGYEGLAPEEKTRREAEGFADGAAVLGEEECFAHAMRGDNVDFQAIQYDRVQTADLKPVIVSGVMPGKLEMAKIAGKAFGNIIRSQLRARKGKL